MESGWHADPLRRAELRYFDGTEWTAHVSNAGVTSLDDYGSRATPVVTLVEQTDLASERRFGDRRRGGRRFEDRSQPTWQQQTSLVNRLMQPLVAIPLVVCVIVTGLFMHSILTTSASSDVAQSDVARADGSASQAAEPADESARDDTNGGGKEPAPSDEREEAQTTLPKIGGADLGRSLPRPTFKTDSPDLGAAPGGLSLESASDAALAGDFSQFPLLAAAGSAVEGQGVALVTLPESSAVPRIASLQAYGGGLLMLRDNQEDQLRAGFFGFSNLISDASVLVDSEGVKTDIVVIAEGSWTLTVQDLVTSKAASAGGLITSSAAFRVTEGERISVDAKKVATSDEWAFVGVHYPDDGSASRVLFVAAVTDDSLKDSVTIPSSGTMQFLLINCMATVR